MKQNITKESMFASMRNCFWQDSGSLQLGLKFVPQNTPKYQISRFFSDVQNF